MSDNRWLRVGVPLMVAVLAGWWMISGGRSSEEDAIRARLLAGKAAWEAKDLAQFMGFFTHDYQDRSGMLNYGALLEIHRSRIFSERCTLQADIDLDHLRVKVAGAKATVSFDATGSRDCGNGPSYFVGQPGRKTPITLELVKTGAISKDWKVAASSGVANADGL